jgi:hypothetical protein
VTTELEQAQKAPPKELLAWLGVMISPLAFLVDLQLSYTLVRPLCAAGGRALIHLPGVLALGMMATGAWIGWTRLSRLRDDALQVRWAERAHFMAVSALVLSAFFVLLVVAMAIAKVVLSPCDR